MTKLSGKCLCGNITYSADTEIKMMANCHCSDCRAATGAAYGTLLFVSEDSLEVQGTPKVFHHVADSDAKMEKHFCSDCGSQLFGKNSGRAGVVSIRAGGLNENDFVKPAVNVYLSSKIDSTPVDPDLKGFDKMPG
jgi:hypothetical protein